MSKTAATFCATLVDEWARGGVSDAFVAPGSRSTPLVLALVANTNIRVNVFHDERSAGFAALGHALATGAPSILTCSSGTAGAHFHAAVIEADLSSVPLIVCTADRPPELLGVGAPQTIDQTKLYGQAVRFFTEPGPPVEDTRASWRSLGSQLINEAMGSSGRAGPVHANLSFRDPLVAEPGEIPPGRPGNQPWHNDLRNGLDHSSVSDSEIEEVWNRLRGLSGVVIAGNGITDPTSVVALSRRLGWPVLADHRSGCRDEAVAVVHFDQLLRSERFAAWAAPDVILRFGEPLASKVLSQWLAGQEADTIAVVRRGQWTDPQRLATVAVAEDGLAKGVLSRIPDDYKPAGAATWWLRADGIAEATISDQLANFDHPTEPGIARAVVQSLPSGSSLVLASSMPVRDVEWFAPARRDVRVYANRGANGIDGVISTAIGVALSGSPTTLLIGDVAFLHDSPALVALRNRPINLTIVVVDNDGGGIFSFLPQANLVAEADFEQLFGTPHGTDIAGLCQAHGISATTWPPSHVPEGAVRVMIASTNRAENVVVHDLLNRSVMSAIDKPTVDKPTSDHPATENQGRSAATPRS